jgi:hypothetical protein
MSTEELTYEELVHMVRASFPSLPEWYAETVAEWYLAQKSEGRSEYEIIASLHLVEGYKKAADEIVEKCKKDTPTEEISTLTVKDEAGEK